MSIGLACFIIYLAGAITWLVVCGWVFGRGTIDVGEIIVIVMAALWPFAVIVIGVALICIGAFTLGEYARKRTKGGA